SALGMGVIMAAVCVLSHRWLRLLTATRHAEPDPWWTATLTTFAGLLLGVFVTRHGVGAGAIGMTALVLLYPRTPIARLVGSDIAHAVPLTLIAGVGHWLLGSVDWVLLGSLVMGSLPGIFFGSQLSARVPDRCCGRSSQQSSSSYACACCKPEHRSIGARRGESISRPGWQGSALAPSGSPVTRR